MINYIELIEASTTQRPVIANLLQLYLHDFSEFGAIGTAEGEVQADGQFPYEWMDRYWEEQGRVPLIIKAESRITGFVLVNTWSALGRPIDHCVAEFFVLRRYRRLDVGSRAASLLFARYPGRWEVPVADVNRSALIFWRKAVRAALGRNAEEVEGDGTRWSGPVLVFTDE